MVEKPNTEKIFHNFGQGCMFSLLFCVSFFLRSSPPPPTLAACLRPKHHNCEHRATTRAPLWYSRVSIALLHMNPSPSLDTHERADAVKSCPCFVSWRVFVRRVGSIAKYKYFIGCPVNGVPQHALSHLSSLSWREIVACFLKKSLV